jgi:hypothetical protein
MEVRSIEFFGLYLNSSHDLLILSILCIEFANHHHAVRNSQAQTLSMREAEISNDRDTHLTSSSVPQVRYRGPNDLRGGATNLDLENVASNSMAVDDIGIRARSQDKRSSNGNLQDAAAGLDSIPKINGTQLKSPLSLPIDDKQFISTLNNTDNMLNSSIDNTGTSARAWPPNADSQSCAATSRPGSATQHDDGDHELIHQHHNTLDVSEVDSSFTLITQPISAYFTVDWQGTTDKSIANR